MHSDPATDSADFHALRRGEDAALNALMARWKKPLFAFAWRYLHNTADANDLVAEVFVRLYRQADKLAPDTRLSAWLFTVLANLCRNHHRWRMRHPSVSLDAENDDIRSGASLASNVPAGGRGPDRASEHNEALDALAAAIDRLPHDLRTTLLLHHYEQLGYREIAGITGCSERGVETRLYRARQYLKTDLSRHLAETARS